MMKPKRITQQQLHDLITKGPLYLYYEFEQAAIRGRYNGKTIDYFVKFQGEPEFKAEKGSGVVTEALMTPYTITQEEYDKF